MYKLYNKLFGWDYIQWTNTAASGVSRVFNDGNKRACYFRYKITGLVDEIKTKEQVFWLTCEPDKYMDLKEKR
jgi:hypothetical protein